MSNSKLRGGRFVFFISAGCVILSDQLSKIWCLDHLIKGLSYSFLDHILSLHLTFNARGAFSLFPVPNFWFIGLVVILLLSLLLYVLFSSLSLSQQLLLGCVFGGGVGNLMDRLRFGYVVDFLDLKYWPAIFNVADAAVSISMTILFVSILLSPAPRRP